MSYDGCHCPRKHGMSTWEGRIKAAVNPKAPVTGSFFRTFAASSELHGGVNQESICKGFEFEFTCLFRVTVLGFNSVGPEADESGTGRIETHVREVSTEIEMASGQCPAELPVGGKKCGRTSKEEHIPFNI